MPRADAPRTATPRSRRPSSTTPSCGGSPATGTSTARTCSSPTTPSTRSALKPMNCPGHCALYAMERHSYRELPVRFSEPGLLHRNEPSRHAARPAARAPLRDQDDAHIFCTEEQIEERGRRLHRLRLARSTSCSARDAASSSRPGPSERIGDDALWDRAEAVLTDALDAPASTTSSTQATAPSTGRRSTCT